MIDIEQYEKFRNEFKSWYEMREYIRIYDNEKYGISDWYGKKDYANLNPDEINARLAEITIEKASK